MSPPRSRRARRGANAIEFALLFPFFTTLLAAFIDFGWMYFQQSVLDTSIAAGCRAGSIVDPGDEDAQFADLEAAAQEATLASVTRSGGGECRDCEVTVEALGEPPGRSLTCQVERPVRPLTGLVMKPVTMRSAIVVRMEWQRE